jgi:tape measure domain-containing protein
MSVVIGDLILNLGLDPSQYTAQLEAAKRQAQTAGADIEKLLKGGAQSLALNVKVDDSPLTALNAHLDLKKQHFQAVQAYFDSNPLTPKVDLTQIKTAQAEIDKLLSKSSQISVGLDLSSARAELVAFKDESSKSLRSQIEIEINASFAGGGSGGGADKIVSAIDKLASEVKASNKSPGMFEYIKQGIGSQLGGVVSTQLQGSLKRNFNVDVPKTVGKGFDAAAQPVKVFFTENPEFQSELQKAGDMLGKRLRGAAYSIGDGIVAAIEDKSGSIEGKLNAFIKDALKPGFQESLAGFGKELQTTASNVGQSVFARKGQQSLLEPVSGALRGYRQAAIEERAIPLVRERAAEILAQKRTKNTANVVDENTKDLVIATGGYAGARGLSGLALPKEFKELLPEGAKMIGLTNPDSDIDKGAMGGALSKLGALTGSLAKPNLRGYSKDAVEAAAQAVAALNRNPNLNVKFMGESGGGFVAEEANAILKAMGAKNVDYLGVGTPDFAGRLDTTQGKKIISPDETLGAETAGLYSRLGLADTSYKQQNILGVEGHPAVNYKNAGVAELTNFFQGAPQALKPEEVGQIKGAAQQFQAQDLEKLDGRQVRDISNMAYKNLQNVRRHVLASTGETAKELQEIADIFEEVYVRSVPEGTGMEQARAVLKNAATAYEKVSASPGLESGKVAAQAYKELQQFQSEFQERYGQAVGTTGAKFQQINKGLLEYAGKFKGVGALPKDALRSDFGLPPDDLPTYAYDQKVDRYRYKTGEKAGQFASRAEVEKVNQLREERSRPPAIPQNLTPEQQLDALTNLGNESRAKQAAATDLMQGDVGNSKLIAATKAKMLMLGAGVQKARAILPAAPAIAADVGAETAGRLAASNTAIEQAIAQLAPIERTGTKEGNQLANLKAQVTKLEKNVASLLKVAKFMLDSQAQVAPPNASEPAIDAESIAVKRPGILPPAEINPSRIAGQAKDLGKTFSDQIKAAQAFSADSPQRAAIAQQIISQTEDARKALDDLIGVMGSNATAEVKKAVSSARQRITKASNKASEINQGMEGVGEQAGAGISQGIGQAIAQVKNASKLLAQAAISEAESTLEIKSPSRVFMRMGVLVAEGFKDGVATIKSSNIAQGLEKAIADAKGAIQKGIPPVQTAAQKQLANDVNQAIKPQPRLGDRAADLLVGGAGLVAGLGTTAVAGPAAGFAAGMATKAAVRGVITPPEQRFSKIAGDVKGDVKDWALGATTAGAPLNLLGGRLGMAKDALKAFADAAKINNPILSGLIDKMGALGGIAKIAAGGFLAFNVAQFAIQNILPVLTQLQDKVIQSAIRLDNLKTALNFASGGSGKGAENLQFIRNTVDDLKIPLGAAEDGFVKLAAAARGSALEGQTTKDTFTGISQAATVLGLNSEQSAGALDVVGKIASKGVVDLGSLREELGGRIPGAFGIAARAMGQSEEQLSKFVETGQLTATEFLPKFAKQLQIEFGGSAVEASKNAQSAMYDLENQTQKLNEAVGKLFQQGAMDWANQLAAGVKFLVQNFDNLIAIATTVGGVIGVGIAQRLLNMAMAAQGSGVLVKLLAQGISGLGSALLGALPAIAAFLGKFILIQAAFEAVRSTASLFQLSDLGKQFEGFGNQATENLKRIGDAADAAAGKVKKVEPPKPGSQSEGFDLTLGLGNAVGLGTVKSDDLLNLHKSIYSKIPGGEKLAGTLGQSFNIPFTDREFKLGTTAGELRQTKETLTADKFNSEVSKTVGKALDPALFKKSLNDAAAIEKQMVDVGNQRSLEAAKVSPDKVKLEALNKQYLELSAKQQTAAAPAAEIQGALGAQKKNALAALEAIDADKTKTDDQKEALKAPYQNAIAQIELAQKSVDKVTAGIKTSASAARNLGDEFAKINSKLGETQRAAERTLTKSTTGSIKDQLASFGGNDRLAGEKAASANAEAEALKAKTLADSGQNALAQQRKLLEGQDVQAVLSGIAQGSTGKSITLDSSIEDIDKAMKGLGDKDANKKGVLEQLKAYKEAGDKQLDLGKNAAQSQLGAKQAKQTEALAKVDSFVGDRTFALNQVQSADALTVKQAQLKGGIVGDGGETEIRKSQISASQQTIQLKEAELAKIKQLKDQGVIDAKTAADREKAIQGELSQEKIKLVDLEVQQKLTYIQWEVDAGKRKTDLAVAGLDREAAAIKLYVNDLDNAGKRLQIQTELVKALADQRQAASKIKIEDASEKLEGAKKLQDEKTGKLERAAIEKQTGLGSNVTGQDIAKLTADKLSEEAKADTDRANALLQQQKLLRQNLELDLKRQEAAAKSAVLEAKKNELLSQQNVLSAKGELAKAKITGDANQIANAESAVQLAQQGVELAGQQTAMAEDNVGVVKELAAGQRQVMAIQQQTERTTLGAEIGKNNRAREREIARVSDEQGLSSAPEVQAAVANLNGNGAPLPQFSPGGVPAANQIQPFNVPQSQPSIESPQFGSGFGGGGQAGGGGVVGGEAVSVLREILGVLKSGGSNKETTINVHPERGGVNMGDVLKEVSNFNRPR